MAELFANRLAKIYIARCYCFIFHWRGFDARPAQCIFLRYFRKRVRAFFFFFRPPPQPQTYRTAPLGRYLFMNPKLRCSRDASVSRDRLKTTVAIQRKLHTRPPRISPFFSGRFFFFFPCFSLSFFFFVNSSSPAMQILRLFELQNAERAYK